LCSNASQEVEVVQSDCGPNDDIYIPNVISPNGDNVNDVFTIFPGADVKIISSEGSIFDRWGSLVHHSTDIPFTWNGYFKGDKLQPAVFVYVLKIKYNVGTNEFEKTYSGNVTVVR
jgi:gliding motility-associated-like protein